MTPNPNNEYPMDIEELPPDVLLMRLKGTILRFEYPLIDLVSLMARAKTEYDTSIGPRYQRYDISYQEQMGMRDIAMAAFLLGYSEAQGKVRWTQLL